MFSFHPYLGKIPILTNIFQMGGSTTNQIGYFSHVKTQNKTMVFRHTPLVAWSEKLIRLARIQVKEKCGDSATEGFEESIGLDQVLQILQGVSCPRDPGSPKLRMVSWNLNTMRFGGDWKPQSSAAENLTGFLRFGGCFFVFVGQGKLL